MRTLLLRALPAAALAAVFLSAPAQAAKTVTVKVGSAPGTPAKYNKVFVTKYGPSKARKVLVLIPGTNGGAGNFSLVGPELAKRVRGLQVWALDRREQALEDTSVMEQARRGTKTPQEALDYYLGWLGKNPKPANSFTPREAKDFAFMKNWGMKVNLEDTRRVVLEARKGGRTVILGGHSLGASFAAAYAAWDFNGRPGYRDISGIVAIDGGLAGTFDSTDTAAKAQAALDGLDVSARNPDGPWANLLGIPGFAWATGAFAEVGALAALKAPTAPSILQGFPLLPGYLKAPFPVTNEGALGFAFDAKTSPANLSLIQVRSGALATSGATRGWVNDGPTPVQNVARGFANGRVNGVDWYYPRRLNVDTDGASSLDPKNPAAKVLGLRLRHLARVNVPYYAFQTSLTGSRDGVVNGARNFQRRSKIRRSQLRVVDRKSSTSHLDPLLAAPRTNDFVKTVVPFLRDTVKLRRR